MNIQELMTVSSERLPIKIILLNNYALGMIRTTLKPLFLVKMPFTISVRKQAHTE